MSDRCNIFRWYNSVVFDSELIFFSVFFEVVKACVGTLWSLLVMMQHGCKAALSKYRCQRSGPFLYTATVCSAPVLPATVPLCGADLD